jgi:putative phosphoribosyl transferase
MTPEGQILNQQVAIKVPEGMIKGLFAIPRQSKTIVIFAHGTGSGRLSPRNRYVADILNQENLATLLIDLLTEEEERIDVVTGQFRFDIEHLSKRLGDVTQWVLDNNSTRGLLIGYFGASTGAAAALKASVQKPGRIKALVARGGRPDMAEDILERVKTPTLLIVGSQDTQVIEMNRSAFEKLPGQKKMIIVPGATHLFEEPGKLEEVANHAKKWFSEHMK